MKRYLYLRAKLSETIRQIRKIEMIQSLNREVQIETHQSTSDLFGKLIRQREILQDEIERIENRFCDLVPVELVIRCIEYGESIRFTH